MIETNGEIARERPRRLARVLGTPELNVAFFAFLLHFVWEMWQVPLFDRMPAMPHWKAVRVCTLASFGDAFISILCFWAVALAAWSRAWVLRPRWHHVVGFAAAGIAITVVLEATALASGRWAYAEMMPTLPLLGTGLAPLLQWVLLPPLVVWLVRRQLG